MIYYQFKKSYISFNHSFKINVKHTVTMVQNTDFVFAPDMRKSLSHIDSSGDAVVVGADVVVVTGADVVVTGA